MHTLRANTGTSFLWRSVPQLLRAMPTQHLLATRGRPHNEGTNQPRHRQPAAIQNKRNKDVKAMQSNPGLLALACAYAWLLYVGETSAKPLPLDPQHSHVYHIYHTAWQVPPRLRAITRIRGAANQALPCSRPPQNTKTTRSPPRLGMAGCRSE
jgi:hypothetical protein